MGLRSYFGGIVKVVTLYASGVLYHGKGVVSYGAGNGSTVGNARGTGANDLQTNRGAATHVASAAYASITGGYNNTASGQRSHVGGGYSNIASGTAASIGGGDQNSATTGTHNTVGGGQSNAATGANHATIGGGTTNAASGNYSTVSGGSTNTASGQGSAIPGGFGNLANALCSTAIGWYAKANHQGEIAQASDRFAATGDAQTSTMVFKATTTDATQTSLASYTLDDDSTYLFTAYIVGRRTDVDGESASYIRHGCIDRNAGTTALVGAVGTLGTDIEDTAAWDVEITADDTADAISIKVTGEAAKTIRWVVYLRLVKVTG